MYLDNLLKTEKKEFLKIDINLSNKDNGYYSRLTKMIIWVVDIKVTRDRLGLSKTLILEIIKNYHE